jgi:hypothetical protein
MSNSEKRPKTFGSFQRTPTIRKEEYQTQKIFYG